jgi:hypothetical protein
VAGEVQDFVHRAEEFLGLRPGNASLWLRPLYSRRLRASLLLVLDGNASSGNLRRAGWIWRLRGSLRTWRLRRRCSLVRRLRWRVRLRLAGRGLWPYRAEQHEHKKDCGERRHQKLG